VLGTARDDPVGSTTRGRTTGGVEITVPERPARRRFGWVLPLAVLVVGAGVAALWATSIVSPRLTEIDEFPRTAIPGETTVVVDGPEQRILYYERRAWLMGVPDELDLDIVVTGPDGSEMRVDPYETDLQYRSVGRVGQAVGSFEAPTAGEYEVTSDGTAPDDARLLVGDRVVESAFRGLGGPLALLTVVVVLAIGLGVRAGRRW
jgi:hypothetical protein